LRIFVDIESPLGRTSLAVDANQVTKGTKEFTANSNNNRSLVLLTWLPVSQQWGEQHIRTKNDMKGKANCQSCGATKYEVLGAVTAVGESDGATVIASRGRINKKK